MISSHIKIKIFGQMFIVSSSLGAKGIKVSSFYNERVSIFFTLSMHYRVAAEILQYSGWSLYLHPRMLPIVRGLYFWSPNEVFF